MRRAVTALRVALGMMLAGCAAAPDVTSPDDHRAAIRQMASDTMAQLYQMDPRARAHVQAAAGYAVFSDVGMKMFYGGAAHGGGLAVDTRTRRETFMKMVELQPGYGFGIERFRNVFVFDTSQALTDFVNVGWEFGANAMAAAQSAGQGGSAAAAVTVSPGVTMYQFTQDGAIAGVSVTGAKYFMDDSLN